MGNIEDNIMSVEKVIYRTTMTKVPLRISLIFIGLCVILMIIASIIGTDLDKHTIGIAPIIFMISLLLFLISLIVLPFIYIKYKTSEYVVTDQRVIIKTGLLNKKSSEILLKKVESVYIEQGIIRRMFNYGLVTITGVGGISAPFDLLIDDPFVFKEHVEEQISKK